MLRIKRRERHWFEYARQNSVWQLYEPVSFDLMEARSIVEKASRWLGRGVAAEIGSHSTSPN